MKERIEINFDSIIEVATDYMDALGQVKRHFPDGLFVNSSTRWGDQAARDMRMFDRAERALYILCDCIGIGTDAAIKATRIYNRYYERGGEKSLDLEKLIVGLNY